MKAIPMKYDADDGSGVDMEMTRNLPSFHDRICPDENLELVRFLRQSGQGVCWEQPERSRRKLINLSAVRVSVHHHTTTVCGSSVLLQKQVPLPYRRGSGRGLVPIRPVRSSLQRFIKLGFGGNEL
ncbi:hypothetical protein Q7C36_011229 [Tachysurus vachellii]|uniref:Uncharacterized protein n=1 Tax=Tachysurus vachellii TaxID=175792 RepID=A0AA88MR68_TACVA|nr:hypothetical protein Q7C36_011229 [Tachysurus vachellii]